MKKQSVLSKSTKYLAIASSITISFFIIELIGGIVTNSLALLADAWHMLNDAVALIFALLAAWFAERPIDVKKTFGYHRTEILAAFLNGIFLLAVAIFISYEAVHRLQNPVVVQSLEMLIIAILGLVANGCCAFTLSKVQHESLNIKGAFLHVLADMLGSVGAISAGVIIYFTEWNQADPIVSIMLSALIFYSSLRLVRESVNVLLEGVPSGIDTSAVEQRILKLEGVEGVHDLHIWCITPTKMCMLSCHIIVKKGTDGKKLIADLIEILKEEFGIDHTTFQIEEEGYPKALSEH